MAARPPHELESRSLLRLNVPPMFDAAAAPLQRRVHVHLLRRAAHRGTRNSRSRTARAREGCVSVECSVSLSLAHYTVRLDFTSAPLSQLTGSFAILTQRKETTSNSRCPFACWSR
jgi:hypothetical protein